jgi:hypothetical protein
MERQYPAYMNSQQQMDLFAQLDELDAGAVPPSDTFKFAVANWRNPAPLGIAETYQLTAIVYALLITVGATPEEFEEEVRDPEFWTGHRITHPITGEDAMLDAIHFVRCTFVKKDATINGNVRKQVFRCLVSLANTLGISGVELARKMKEELVVADED